MNSAQRIFVYGSLKRGHRLHHCLSSQRFLGNAMTLPNYKLFDCGSYPGLVHSTGDGKEVHGELYFVNPRARCVLDDVEGVAEGLYSLQRIQLQAPFHNVPVFAYFYELPTDDLPECGNRWPAVENRYINQEP